MAKGEDLDLATGLLREFCDFARRVCDKPAYTLNGKQIADIIITADQLAKHLAQMQSALSAAREDAARLDWLEAEHMRLDPVGVMTVKYSLARNTNKWANGNDGTPVRALLDHLMANARECPHNSWHAPECQDYIAGVYTEECTDCKTSRVVAAPKRNARRADGGR